MNIKTFALYEQLSLETAEEVSNKIHEGLKTNGKFVLGLATGATPIGMYKDLIPLLGRFSADLSQLYTFNLDEYLGLTHDDKNSYFNEMSELFWRPLHEINPTFNMHNAYIPDTETEDPEEECELYEEEIKNHGGIDLQILGIGTNGHIAFNEPGAAGDSRTRKVEVAEETRQVNAEKFFNGDISKVPTHALSMGIGTILEAKEIYLLAAGESKREILKKVLDMKEPSVDVPASFLKNHPNVTIFTDISF